MTATDTTIFSYSVVIRDMLLAKLVAEPFFAGFNIRKSRQLQVQPQHLPYLGCYVISEEMDKDGDINTGEIRFIHHLKLGFTVAVQNNDPEACEEKLDQAFWTIMNTLWRDPYLMNFIDTRAYPGGVGNPDNTRIEGVEKGSRRHRFGTAGLNNETPIGELQYEATVMYRAYYEPIITDDLLQIHQETVPLATDGTIPPADEVQRVFTEYTFDPATGGTVDTTPPTVPTALTATPISTTEIDLAWTASTDNVGVTGYQIRRDGSLATTVTATSFNDTGLLPDTTYSYQVKAMDAAMNASAAAAASAKTLAATAGVSYLEATVGVVPATINMFPWAADATHTDFTWTDASVNGHPGGFSYYQVLAGAATTGPDGAATGQHITETAISGLHRLYVFNGPQCHTSSNISFRVAVIAKAAERTRIVVLNEVFGHEAAASAGVGFDLTGGNVGYDITTGTNTVVTATAMTALVGGWWLCQFDMHYTGAYAGGDFVWQIKIDLDNGSGTAARSNQYAGDGASGVHMWWLNMLPTAAWQLTTTVFRDDFTSLATLDLANTLSPGFNWYLNNNAPNSLNTAWWSNLPVSSPANFTLSSPGVLQLLNPNANAPKWDTMIYTCGFPVAGGHVGQSWQAPMVFDGMFQWDSTLGYSNYGLLGPAFWGHTVEAMDNTMNPSKHWMEWDITDLGGNAAGMGDTWLNAVNAVVSDGVTLNPSVVIGASEWHRVSGLWLNMAATGVGQGLFMMFFDGSFTQFSDAMYTASDFPQPPAAHAKGWNSQAEWQHMQLMLNTGNNTSAGAYGGWPMRVDYVRTIVHPNPPKIYDFWDIFDQLGDITVTNNALTLTKTAAGTVWEAIRGSFGKSTGKWYWEVTITGTVASANALMLGVMSEAASVASNAFPGSSAQGAGARHGSNWNSFVSGVTGGYSGAVTFASGDVYGFAFNADIGKMYVHRNGTWINGAPGGGTEMWSGLMGHIWYPAAAIHDASVATMVGNFGATAFAYAIPSGYLGLAAN